MIKVQPLLQINKITYLNNAKNKLIGANKVFESLPIVETPILAFSLKGDRDRNLSTYCSNAIAEINKKFKNNKINEKERNEQVAEMKQYYEESKNLDPQKYSSARIKQGQPKFGSTENFNMELDHEFGDIDTKSIENINLDLPPELQDFLDSPIHQLTGNIFSRLDDIKDNILDFSGNIYDSLKSTFRNIINM